MKKSLVTTFMTIFTWTCLLFSPGLSYGVVISGLDRLWQDYELGNEIYEDAFSIKGRPLVISNSNGGAFISNSDYMANRPSYFSSNVYHLDHEGTLLWSASAGTSRHAMATNTNGDLIIAYYNGSYVYAKCLSAVDGTLLWGPVQVSDYTPGISDVKPYPIICSDDVGGAYIGWFNRLNHVSSSGNVDIIDGIELFITDLDSFIVNPHRPAFYEMISDGTGGVFPQIGGGTITQPSGVYVVWNDEVCYNPLILTLKAQHIKNGTPQWGTNGITVGQHSGSVANLALDGNAGFFISWVESYYSDILLAQKLDTNGNAQWTSGGVVVVDYNVLSDSIYEVRGHKITSDGAGGAFIVWTELLWIDYVLSTNEQDVIAQYIDSSGTPQWEGKGITLQFMTSAGTQNQPTIVSDTVGGALVAFTDLGYWSPDITFGRLNHDGVVLMQNGLLFMQKIRWDCYLENDPDAICNSQRSPDIVFDGSGPDPTGAIIVWHDRNEDSPYYHDNEFLAAQKIRIDTSPPPPPPSEVWVDDDYTSTNTGGHTWGVDAFNTIQEGIDAVNSPGSVRVGPGYYIENITLRSGVEVDGAGPYLTTIDGNGIDSVVKGENVDATTGFYGFTITNGTSSYGGGGIYLSNSNPQIDRCIILENGAYSAGGMFNVNSSPSVTNCTFINNGAGWIGGIYNYNNSSPSIINCTFYGNYAIESGACLVNYTNSSPTVRNCIMWGNSPGEIENDESSVPQVTYSNIQGGYVGTGNINADPLFVDAANGDLHLQAGSPCIDAGTAAGKVYGMELVPRPQDGDGLGAGTTGDGSDYDMGVFENVGVADPGSPDLVLEAIGAGSPEPGEPVTVTVTVKNQGDAPAGTFALDFYKQRDTAPDCLQWGDENCAIFGLDAGMTTSCTFTVTYNNSGTYNMWAFADTGCSETESNEDNNILGPQMITVQAADEDGDGYVPPLDCDDDDDLIYPGAPELCDGLDNDCDGPVDENLSRACSSVCGSGTETCSNGSWVGCTAPQPQTEICDGLDNDCDGQIDENLSRSCTSPCGSGTETCSNGSWVGCTAPQPQTEICDDLDNDCDSQIDENLSRSCTSPCGSGTETCSNGSWVGCTAPEPQTEVCDGQDNNCNGQVDENLSRSCTSPCGSGTETCNSGSWVGCTAPQPQTEVCDGTDNDCDGQIDEGLSTDGDGDGHYAPGSCLQPADDCDDYDAALWDCNTPAGEDVEVIDDTGDVTITFDEVTSGGDTQITLQECENTPEGIMLAPAHATCMEITTDAEFDGIAQICLAYDDTGMTALEEALLQLVHVDSQGNVELLPCDPPVIVDTVGNTVCGCTTHFSQFAIGIMGDSDGDEIADVEDNCPYIENEGQGDWDEDGRGDACDNCWELANSGQVDTDSDGLGDACDSDDDNDDFLDQDDNCPINHNFEQKDSYPPQENGCGDACECEGNFDGDEDQDGADALTFKQDFGRNSYENPCESTNPCNGNFDCDDNVDGADAFIFKEDFGRNQYFNPCPNCVTVPWCE